MVCDARLATKDSGRLATRAKQILPGERATQCRASLHSMAAVNDPRRDAVPRAAAIPFHPHSFPPADDTASPAAYEAGGLRD